MDPGDSDNITSPIDSEVSEDRVSVIKWATKRVDSSEPSDTDLTQESESNDETSMDDDGTDGREMKPLGAGSINEDSNDKNSTDEENTSGNASDSDSDVEFIGEYFPPKIANTPTPFTKNKPLPSFFQFAPWGSCYQNNPYIQNAPLALGLPSHTQNWLQTRCKYTNQFQYGYNYPFNLVTVALRARAQMHQPKSYIHPRPPRILPRPVAKPNADFQSLMEVSETEYVETKVYHLDRNKGILKYKCKTCDTFIRKKTISKTRPVHGNKNPPNKCRICSKTFFTCKQLQSHLFRHSEKKLCCSYCSKKFLTKSEMNNHINTHTGQKPFQCPVCSASFAQSSRYYTHIRDLHKKYHCDECFKRNYNNNEEEK